MMRMLQVPELKRAMGFSEGFNIERGTRRERIRLLGNAVCPPIMEAVIRSLARAGAGKIDARLTDRCFKFDAVAVPEAGHPVYP